MKIYLKNYVLWVLILGTLQSLTAQTNDHDFPIANNILKKFVNPITETPKENYKDWLEGTSWEFTEPLEGTHTLNFLPDLKFDLITTIGTRVMGEYKFSKSGDSIIFDNCMSGVFINDKKAFYIDVTCSSEKQALKNIAYCGKTVFTDCEYNRIK